MRFELVAYFLDTDPCRFLFSLAPFESFRHEEISKNKDVLSQIVSYQLCREPIGNTNISEESSGMELSEVRSGGTIQLRLDSKIYKDMYTIEVIDNSRK